MKTTSWLFLPLLLTAYLHGGDSSSARDSDEEKIFSASKPLSEIRELLHRFKQLSDDDVQNHARLAIETAFYVAHRPEFADDELIPIVDKIKRARIFNQETWQDDEREIISEAVLLAFKEVSPRPVVAMLNAGLDPNFCAKKYGYHKQSLMRLLCKQKATEKFIDVIALALTLGASLGPDNRELTPLMMASAYGNTEIVEMLLDRGADINARGIRGITALHSASQDNQIEVVRILLARGADATIENSDGGRAIIFACISGHGNLVRFFLEQGVNFSGTNRQGLRIIDQALLATSMSLDANVDVIALLLDLGANIEASFERGWTPLLTATYEGNNEIALYLIERGANVKVRSVDGFTPLSTACDIKMYNFSLHPQKKVCSHRVVKALIGKGAIVEEEVQGGFTPLLLASSTNNLAIVRELVLNRANVNAVNSLGWSPLMITCYFESDEIADFLLENGADLKYLFAGEQDSKGISMCKDNCLYRLRNSDRKAIRKKIAELR